MNKDYEKIISKLEDIIFIYDKQNKKQEKIYFLKDQCIIANIAIIRRITYKEITKIKNNKTNYIIFIEKERIKIKKEKLDDKAISFLNNLIEKINNNEELEEQENILDELIDKVEEDKNRIVLNSNQEEDKKKYYNINKNKNKIFLVSYTFFLLLVYIIYGILSFPLYFYHELKWDIFAALFWFIVLPFVVYANKDRYMKKMMNFYINENDNNNLKKMIFYDDRLLLIKNNDIYEVYNKYIEYLQEDEKQIYLRIHSNKKIKHILLNYIFLNYPIIIDKKYLENDIIKNELIKIQKRKVD